MLAAAVALSSFARPAGAEPTPTNQAAAQSLFEEARQLVARGSHAEACLKFEESQRLDPGGGTLLNLALCHEQIGKTATAWAEFNEALGLALRDGREVRVKNARAHIAQLEPRLSRIVVMSTPTNRVPGIRIMLDGVTLGEAAWGTPTPVDPGPHVLAASAPGHRDWKTEVNVQGDAALVEIQLPALERLPEASRPAIVDDESHEVRATEPSYAARRGVGYALVGTGVVAVGVGSVFGALALSSKQASDDLCEVDDACEPGGAALNATALERSWISTAAFGAGVVALGIGGYLLLVNPSRAVAPSKARERSSRGSVSVVPALDGGRLGVSLRGAF